MLLLILNINIFIRLLCIGLCISIPTFLNGLRLVFNEFEEKVFDKSIQCAQYYHRIFRWLLEAFASEVFIWNIM